MHEQGFTSTQIIMAFAGGAMLGTAAALILAPRRGVETRARIKELGKVPRALRDAGGAARVAFRDAFEQGAPLLH